MPEPKRPAPPRVTTPGPRRPDALTLRDFAAIVAAEQNKERRSLSRLSGLGRWRRWA